MNTTNVMAFAHFKVKRLIRMGAKLKYAFMLKRELSSAHYMAQRQGLEFMTAELKAYAAIEKRVEREKSVVRKVVRNALNMGYSISLYDGEEWTIQRATTEKEVMSAIQTTDADTLRFRKIDDVGTPVGSVYFVYGNSASEVMNDWTDTEEVAAILAPALKLCDRLALIGQ